LARVRRQGQTGIEEDEGHLEHRMTLSSVPERPKPGPGRSPMRR
jgi:hypothetical protein